MKSSRSRGFTLIEALVALTVMAFGMLGVLGIQSALRQYSDISKQRSEAVRLSQESTENWRAFKKLDTDAAMVDYTDIASDGPYTVTGTIASATNTTYTMQHVVTTLPTSGDLPQRGKWLTTTVRWNDRTGAEQRVDFFTHVSGVSPELAGTLLVPPAGGAGAIRRPQGRNAGIPRSAVDDGSGHSTFAPPGLPGTVWTFDNLTGVITRICNPTCTGSDFVGYLLAGYVRLSDPGCPSASPSCAPPLDPAPAAPVVFRQPTGANSENPGASPVVMFSPATIGVSVAQTAPTSGTIVCATQTFPLYVAYFCAVPTTLADAKWSGRSYITGPTFATTAADTTTTLARSCRYTPQTTEPPVPALQNFEHPYTYTTVAQPLINQDFLLIRAGDGTTAFACPGDDTSTPFVNGNTFTHQPAP